MNAKRKDECGKDKENCVLCDFWRECYVSYEAALLAPLDADLRAVFENLPRVK